MKNDSNLPPPDDPSWCRAPCPDSQPQRTVEAEVKVSGPTLLNGPKSSQTLGYLAPPGMEAWEWTEKSLWKPILPVGVLENNNQYIGFVPTKTTEWPIGLWLREEDEQKQGRLAGESFAAKDVQIDDCSKRVSTLAKGYGMAFATGAPPETAESVHRAARSAARLNALIGLYADLREAWNEVSCPEECPHKRARFLTVVGWRVHMDAAVPIWLGVGPIFISSVALEAAIEIEFYCVLLV